MIFFPVLLPPHFLEAVERSPGSALPNKHGLLLLIWLDLAYCVGGETYYRGMDTLHSSLPLPTCQMVRSLLASIPLPQVER